MTSMNTSQIRHDNVLQGQLSHRLKLLVELIL
jgi:hypothetical protein